MTFQDQLDAIKWPMYEKGLQRVFNVLQRMANAALAGFTGEIGAIDLVTDLTPDVTATYPNPGTERISEKEPRNGFVAED